MRFFKFSLPLLLSLSILLLLLAPTSRAGDYVLTNNSGSASDVFFIIGEPSLVMNGFDLQPRGITRPTQLDRVSIDVVTPIPNQPVEVVVYQDPDGGDPINSTLVGRQTVNITQSGIFTATFNPPLQITDPVVWVGFYLPVGFEFRADRSGTSVLTYWAWTPNSTFDLANLRSAQVFGPGDGSQPVDLNMNGIARITAELITGGTATQPTTTPGTTGPIAQPTITGSLDRIVRDSQGRIVQALGDQRTSLVPMRPYPDTDNCGAIYYDSEDLRVNYRGSVAVGCKARPTWLAPQTPDGYRLASNNIFDVTFFGLVSPGTDRMFYPITHCIQLSADNPSLNSAVIGLAYGAPHQWEILPTVRYGQFICADLYYAGSLAYFVPVN